MQGKKGFGGIILALAVIVAAALLLSMTNEARESYSFKETLPQIKTYLSNYEINLNLIARDYNQDPNFPMRAMVDSNAQSLLNNKTLDYLDCSYDPTTIIIPDNNTAQFDLDCNATVRKDPEILTVQLVKRITVKRG